MGRKEEKTVIDPIVTQAWRRWKSSFSWKWIVGWMVVLAGLGIGYWKITASEWRFVVVSVMSVVIMMGVRLPWLVWEMVSVSSKNGLFNKKHIRLRNAHSGKPEWVTNRMCQSFVIWLLWMVGVVAVKRVGWFAENIDNGTALFLLYLPAVWLFGIKRAVNGFLALVIIPFLPFFLGFGMERTAEIWAVVLYFLLVVATVQMVREVREGDDD